MLELVFNILATAGTYFLWWLAASFVVLPFWLALARANGPDREPARIRPRIVAVDGRRIGER